MADFGLNPSPIGNPTELGLNIGTAAANQYQQQQAIDLMQQKIQQAKLQTGFEQQGGLSVEHGAMPKNELISQLQAVLATRNDLTDQQKGDIIQNAKDSMPDVLSGWDAGRFLQTLREGKQPPTQFGGGVSGATILQTDPKAQDLNDNPLNPQGFYQMGEDGSYRLTSQPPAEVTAAGKLTAPSTWSFVGNSADGTPVLMNKQGEFKLGDVGGTGNSPVLPKSSTMPTSQARSTAEFAETVLPHIDEMRSLIQQADAAGYIGPAAGRIYGEFLVGKVGSTGDAQADQLLGHLRAVDSLMKTATMKVHFGSRGGQQMYDHFSEMLNTGKQSAATLNGALDGIESFMQGYAQAGNPQTIGQPINAPNAPSGIAPAAPTPTGQPTGNRRPLADILGQ